MLDGAGNPAGDVEVALEFLSAHADIAFNRNILQGFSNRAGGANCRASSVSQFLNEFHVFFFSNALTGTDNAFSVNNRRIHRDADREVIAIPFQGFNKGSHLFFRRAIFEDHLLAGACNGLFLAGPTAAMFGVGQTVRNMGCNNDTLDLVGAFVNRSDLRVAVHPFDIHPLEVARTAKDLKGIVCDFNSKVRSIELCHGGLHAIIHMFRLHFSRTVNEETGSSQSCCHISQLEGNTLVLADRRTKLDSFLGIV